MTLTTTALLHPQLSFLLPSFFSKLNHHPNLFVNVALIYIVLDLPVDHINALAHEVSESRSGIRDLEKEHDIHSQTTSFKPVLSGLCKIKKALTLGALGLMSVTVRNRGVPLLPILSSHL